MGNTPLLDALLQQVKVYCDGGRGRRADLVRHLGVRPHMLTAWLDGTRAPGGEYTLQMQCWLKTQAANTAAEVTPAASSPSRRRISGAA